MWLHQPWAIGTCVPLALDSAAIALARFGSGAIEAHKVSSEGPHRFWASLSQDPHSRERKRMKRVLCAAHGSWEIIVLDSPRQLSLRQWAGEIKPEREWKFLEYITSHLGSLSARKRKLAIWGAPPEFALEGLKVTPHPSLAMLPLDPKSPAARVEGTLVQEPTLVTTGDRWLPHPYGHVRHRGADLLVHSVKGPAGAFTISHDAGGVRALTDGEVLACQGVYPQALQSKSPPTTAH